MYSQQSFSLFTDLYQLTMAQGYWEAGKKNQQAVFHLSFRKNPFKGGYIIFCGLKPALEAIEKFFFSADDLKYLASLKSTNKQPVFSKKFLNFLKDFKINCTIKSLPEGTVIFAGEPVLQVAGTLLECQLLESLLLNIINFQSLIATKSARIFSLAQNKSILEFGLRRAQGIDGAISASRAAYIGGSFATSNLLAAKIYNIPVIGTHSHSWVLSFASEKLAFEQFIRSFPKKFSLLIDTYSALSGIKNAIEVVKKHSSPNSFFAVRIDSGDLAYLSKKIRHFLDQAGFTKTKIIASGDLDEYIIASLKEQQAAIDIWAVGTKLITATDEPALNGVYKLSAIYEEKNWRFCTKISDDLNKSNDPGILQIMRFFSPDGLALGDAIYNQLEPIKKNTSCTIINPNNNLQQKVFSSSTLRRNILQIVMKNGKISYTFPTIEKVRKNTINQLSKFDDSIKRLVNPHLYPVGLEKKLFNLKKQLISQYKTDA